MWKNGFLQPQMGLPRRLMLLNALADEDAKSAEDGEDNSHEKEEDNQQVSFSRNATV